MCFHSIDEEKIECEIVGRFILKASHRINENIRIAINEIWLPIEETIFQGRNASG